MPTLEDFSKILEENKKLKKLLEEAVFDAKSLAECLYEKGYDGHCFKCIYSDSDECTEVCDYTEVWMQQAERIINETEQG